MRKTTRWASALAVTAITALAGWGAAPAQADRRPPVVVELFTSQGCYSCPPAEAYLRDLAVQDGIVALEFHVDYWDGLTYMWHGSWKDPFSSPTHTYRQRLYNVSIRKQPGVYTPQMIIDGWQEAVGSRKADVQAAIARAATGPKLAVAVQGTEAARRATIAGSHDGPAEVFLARFLKSATTRVNAGENHDKTLMSAHVVTGLQKLGEWTGAETSFALPPGPEADAGCAVIVQAKGQGRIVGAALCP